MPSEVAIRTRGDEFTITWGELRERVDALAGGLAKLGVQRGDSVALMLSNRPEFHLCDLAAMMLGATPFSIYNTYTAEQIQYLHQRRGSEGPDLRAAVPAAGARGAQAAAEPRLRDRRRRSRRRWGRWRCPTSRAPTPTSTSTRRSRRSSPTDVLTLIYTSGTTGPPKGVQLVHRNLLATVEGIEDLIEFPATAA